MAREFEITDIDLISYYLGIEMKQTKMVLLYLKKAMQKNKKTISRSLI